MGFLDEARKSINEVEKRQLEKEANKKLQRLLQHREMLNNKFFGPYIRREIPTLEQDIEELKQALKRRDHDEIKMLVNNLPSLKQVEKIQNRSGFGALLIATPILLGYIVFFIFLLLLLVFFLILIF